MTHQPLPIVGYTAQNENAVARVNDNKRREEELLRHLDAYASCNSVDQRWVALARSHIEQGFMALNRAVFKPGRVRLPEDTTEDDDGA